MNSQYFSLDYHALKFVLQDVCFDIVYVLCQMINGLRTVCVYDGMICCCKEDMSKREAARKEVALKNEEAKMKKEKKEVRV